MPHSSSRRDAAGSEGRGAADAAPPVPRPAATIMVVRDAPSGGLEVLMLRRNLRSDFVGGAYVFPGGAVDAADRTAEAGASCRGRSDAEASALLGLPEGGLAYWVAAVRECFEEAGVLLAYEPPRDPAPPSDDLVRLLGSERERRFTEHRRAINEGRLSFVELCAGERLSLAADRVHYFAHWITPVGAPRRYDTRFFVAEAAAAQRALHDAGETIADVWTTPERALERHRAGEIDLIFPTIRNLQAIARFPSAAALVAAAAEAADRVPAVEPKVVVDGNGVRILLPGDDGYDEAAGLAPSPGGAQDQATTNEAIVALSRAANQAPPEPPPPSAGSAGEPR